jgi:TonB family protein
MAMNLRISKWFSFWLLLLAATSPCFGQDSRPNAKAVVLPETVMAARLSHFVAPKPPEGAVGKRCSNALVMLKVTVDENGKVNDVEVLSGYNELRDSTITAVKQWTYKPYKEHGGAIIVQTHVSVFYLGDGEAFPMYSPDGRGGVKGGTTIPLPAGCNSGPRIKRVPS